MNPMRVLATAYPSIQYRWYRNFDKVLIEARIMNNRITYYEVSDGKQKRLSEETVRSLFPIGCSIKEQPFLIRDNRDFYTVLNRHRKRFLEQFKEIKRRR